MYCAPCYRGKLEYCSASSTAVGLPGASPRCRARFLKPHKMVAQEQGSRAPVTLLMAGTYSARCFEGGRVRVGLAGDEPASAVWRVYVYFSQGRQRWTNRDFFSRSSGNALPNVSMATQHSGHSLAGVMHLRQRSTTTELCPCCSQDLPPALRLARHRLTMAKPSA